MTLRVALSSGSYAATAKLLPKNSVGSSQVPSRGRPGYG
jgi:hypothetical protein